MPVGNFAAAPPAKSTCCGIPFGWMNDLPTFGLSLFCYRGFWRRHPIIQDGKCDDHAGGRTSAVHTDPTFNAFCFATHHLLLYRAAAARLNAWLATLPATMRTRAAAAGPGPSVQRFSRRAHCSHCSNRWLSCTLLFRACGRTTCAYTRRLLWWRRRRAS